MLNSQYLRVKPTDSLGPALSQVQPANRCSKTSFGVNAHHMEQAEHAVDQYNHRYDYYDKVHHQSTLGYKMQPKGSTETLAREDAESAHKECIPGEHFQAWKEYEKRGSQKTTVVGASANFE